MNVLDRFDLNGKRALITGGSSGIGQAIALAFADAGADTTIVCRDDLKAQTTVQAIESRRRIANVIPADLSDPTECARAGEVATREFGPHHILVNNVGGRTDASPIEQTSISSWQHAIQLNLTSAFIMSKIVGEAMIRDGIGGRIINVASTTAFAVGRSNGGRSYEAAKAALVQFTRALALDWAPHKINANAICPGAIDTERWHNAPTDVINRVIDDIPLGELGQPSDLGPLAVFLASDASRYVTGTAIVVDGGLTIH